MPTAKFIKTCENDYFTEWIWFPLANEVWANSWNNDGIQADSQQMYAGIQFWLWDGISVECKPNSILPNIRNWADKAIEKGRVVRTGRNPYFAAMEPHPVTSVKTNRL